MQKEAQTVKNKHILVTFAVVEKMATRKNRVRFTLDVNFPSTETKTAFLAKLDAVRKLLTPAGTLKLNNYDLLSALFRLAEGQSADRGVHARARSALSSEGGEGSVGGAGVGAKTASLLESSGEMNTAF